MASVLSPCRYRSQPVAEPQDCRPAPEQRTSASATTERLALEEPRVLAQAQALQDERLASTIWAENDSAQLRYKGEADALVLKAGNGEALVLASRNAAVGARDARLSNPNKAVVLCDVVGD